MGTASGSPQGSAPVEEQRGSKKAAKSEAILKPPAKKFSAEHAEKYFAWQNKLPEVQWAHLTPYLYRLWPVIIKTPSYVDKFAGPFTSQDVLEKWGAGKYQIRLSDSTRNEGGQICTVLLNLDSNWHDHPPVMGPGELDMSHPNNKGYIEWARSKGLIPMAGTAPAAQDSAVPQLVDLLKQLMVQKQQTDPYGAKAIETVLGMMEAANKRSVDLVAAAQKPATGSSGVELLTAVTPLLLPIIQKMLQPGPDPLALLAAAKDLFGPKGNPQTGDIADLTRTLDLLDRIEKRSSKGDGEGWMGVAKYGIEKIPETLENLTGLFEVLSRKPPQAAQTRTASNAPTVEARGLPSAEAQPETTAHAPETTEARPLNEEETEQVKKVVTAYAAKVAAALKGGVTGDEFAEAIQNMVDLTAYEQIAALGRDQIIDALKANAKAWVEIEKCGDERLNTFLAEFFDFGAPDDSAEEAKTPAA